MLNGVADGFPNGEVVGVLPNFNPVDVLPNGEFDDVLPKGDVFVEPNGEVFGVLPKGDVLDAPNGGLEVVLPKFKPEEVFPNVEPTVPNVFCVVGGKIFWFAVFIPPYPEPKDPEE